jgi:hypothetical protein
VRVLVVQDEEQLADAVARGLHREAPPMPPVLEVGAVRLDPGPAHRHPGRPAG